MKQGLPPIFPCVTPKTSLFPLFAKGGSLGITSSIPLPNKQCGTCPAKKNQNNEEPAAFDYGELTHHNLM